MSNARKLVDLDPMWARDAAQDITGVIFQCPCCDDGHYIEAHWAGPSPFPSGAMWRLESAPDFALLTLSPSIDLTRTSNCTFHGWVRDGVVTW